MIDLAFGAFELNQIYTGDARELAKRIPDESIDLIFTDPVYDHIDDYHWLAETAARVLKPNSAALVWCATQFIHLSAMALVNGGLSIRWFLSAVVPSGFPSRFYGKIFGNYMICIYAEKGNSQPIRHVSDVIYTSNGAKFQYHAWGKNIEPFINWLEKFSDGDSIVFDPFTGGGTVPAVCKMLGRNYIAFEIDPDVAERARERVRNTQPPLFVPQPEQIAFEMAE